MNVARYHATRRYARAVVFLLACSLTATTVQAGAPFVTDDADTPEAHHYEINVSLQYTRFMGGSAGTVPAVEVNYGVTDKLQISALVPMNFIHTDGIGTNIGVGDSEIGIKYRFLDADDWGWRPGIAFAPVLVIPSGSEIRGLGDGRITAFLPIFLSKEFKQWTVFGGGGYNINPGPDHLNWWFAGVGVVRELDPAWTVGVEIYHTTPVERGLKDNTGMNIGVIYNVSDNHHLMMSVGRNLINARENNEFSSYLGYQLTF